MKVIFAAAFGLALVAAVDGVGATAGSQGRTAGRPHLQLVFLCRRRRYSFGLRTWRPQPSAAGLQCPVEEQVRVYDIFLQPTEPPARYRRSE